MKKEKLISASDAVVDKAVKIRHTDFNRQKKLKSRDLNNIDKLYSRGVSINKLATIYGVAPQTIKYHVDPVYRLEANIIRQSYATGVAIRDLHDRAAYKRTLLLEGKIKEEDIC